jgi:urea transport system ATP-binding protein
MLEIQGINTFYGTSHILHDFSLKLATGEMDSILGRNGAGKTTLLRSIMGLIVPRSGKILFDGHDITNLKSNARAALGISYVPQGREIIPDLSVRDNLRLALLGKGKNGKLIPDYVFDYFPKLKTLLDRKGGYLSGGEQQQLAIGRALIQEPKLLILDEPTEGLQPSVVEEIEDRIKEIHKRTKNTILIVEQRLDFIKTLTQAFSIIDNGRIVAGGAISDLTDSVVKTYLTV